MPPTSRGSRCSHRPQNDRCDGTAAVIDAAARVQRRCPGRGAERVALALIRASLTFGKPAMFGLAVEVSSIPLRARTMTH